MIYALNLVFGVLIGILVARSYFMKRLRAVEKELRQTCRELIEEQELAEGLGTVNERRRRIIEERKRLILEALPEESYLQSSDVADMFEVSRSTALRYLSELVEEEKLVQVDTFGRNVRYKSAN